MKNSVKVTEVILGVTKLIGEIKGIAKIFMFFSIMSDFVIRMSDFAILF